jgi:hypothetical protein
MGLIILNINSLLRDFSNTFYTEPLMILLNVLFLILAIRLKPGDKKFRVFIVYAIAALLQDVICMGVSLTDLTAFELGIFSFKLISTATIIFIQIEFFIFYRFFNWEFKSKQVQKLAQTSSNIFILLSLLCSLYFIFFTPYKTIHVFLGYLSAISSVLQLILAFYYFYTLFKEPPVKNLLREPSFWIATGIAFVHGLNIPLFLMNDFLMNRFNTLWFHLYTINFIAYCFLFVLLIISLLCDKPDKKEIQYKNSSVSLNKF